MDASFHCSVSAFVGPGYNGPMLQAFLSALMLILAGPLQEQSLPGCAAAARGSECGPLVHEHIGIAMTTPNIGGEGTLDILEGNGSTGVWSFDAFSNTWRTLANTPGPIRAGAALSNLFGSCDFAFAGGGSTMFFTTGTLCSSPHVLASAPSPIGAGAALSSTTLDGAPADLVFALRGEGTSDFWQYSISNNAWTVLPGTPAPVGNGAAAVEVVTCGAPGIGYQIAALRGGQTTDFWCFDIQNSVWLSSPAIPPVPAPIGQGGAIAQLQRFGRIYALRGGGTSDFWVLQEGAQEKWAPLSKTPGPVNAGGALVGVNYGTNDQRDILYALQGGRSNAIWRYDVASDTWTQIGALP